MKDRFIAIHNGDDGIGNALPEIFSVAGLRAETFHVRGEGAGVWWRVDVGETGFLVINVGRGRGAGETIVLHVYPETVIPIARRIGDLLIARGAPEEMSLRPFKPSSQGVEKP